MAKSTGASTESRSRLYFWSGVGSTAAAVLVHLYLLKEHYALHYGEASAQSLCNINELFSCASVAASRYSAFLGIPMALWGAVVNAALIALALLYPIADDEKKPAASRNVVLVSGFIAFVSVVMGGISLALLGRYCPFCILAYVLSFISFAMFWLRFRRPKSAGALPTGKSFAFGDLTSVIVLFGVAGFFAMVTNDQVQKAYGRSNTAPVFREKVQEWEQRSPVQFPAADPLTLGAPAGKAVMTITEFADFRCIHCKHAAPVLKAFVSAHPDARLEYYSWPLDGECNTSISQTNGASCLLARAVHCAAKVGGPHGGWRAHQFVFENQEAWSTKGAIEGRMTEIAKAAGITSEQLVACTQTPEAKEAVEKQAAAGTALSIQGTPTIYVNGKKLDLGQTLQVLNMAYERLKAQPAK